MLVFFDFCPFLFTIRNMAERIIGTEFDFEFLRSEPHQTMEDLLVINNAAHLTNHLADHRKIPQSTIDTEAEKLNMGINEKRICSMIVEEIEKVGGGNYRDISIKVLDEGRRQAMVAIEDMWRPIIAEIDSDPVLGENVKKALLALKNKTISRS